MKAKTIRSLKRYLIIAIMFSLISCSRIIVDIMYQRSALFIFFSVLILSAFIFIVLMISLDLIYKDYNSLKGRLIERKGTLLKIITKNETIKKFRVNTEFEENRGISLNEEIEIEYFRRTRAVTFIKSNNNSTEDT